MKPYSKLPSVILSAFVKLVILEDFLFGSSVLKGKPYFTVV